MISPIPSGLLVRRLQVCAESQQTAVAILDHEPPLAPWRIAKCPGEFHALGGVLGIKTVTGGE